MESSQEKLDSYIDTIEKNITGEMNTEQQDANKLKLILSKQAKAEYHSLTDMCSALEEKVKIDENHLKDLKDEIDCLTFQTIANKESFKIQEAEKEKQIKALYAAEEKKTFEEAENVNKECKITEQELMNQIALEKATKNARLYEIKGNLQRQLTERNTEYARIQTENNQLKREIEGLRTAHEPKRNEKGHIMNVMQFNNDWLVQEAQNCYTNKFNSVNESYPDQSISVCTIDKPKAQLEKNSFSNPFHTSHKQPAKSVVEQNAENGLTNLEDEYEEFQNTFVQPEINIQLSTQKNSCWKPNPFNIMANSEISSQTEYPGDGGLKSNGSGLMQTDSLEIKAETSFLDALTRQNESYNNMPNVSRNLPTVYMGNARKRNYYKTTK